MTLLIYLLLISNLSILIVSHFNSIFVRGMDTNNPNELDPIEIIKRRINNFIEFEASSNAADDSVHNITLVENGYISETKLWIVWKGLHQKNKIIAAKIYANIDNYKIYENEIYWLKELGAQDPEIESRGILRVFHSGVFLIYHRVIATTMFEKTLEDLWKERKQQNKKISELSILLIFKRGVEILKYFNEKSVLHNDIKPSNILLHGQKVFISGFDYAASYTGRIVKDGTPEFASSNWYCGRERSAFDDLESLVFSLWHVAGIPRDKEFFSQSDIPEGKTLYKCLKKDDGRVGERAIKKMEEKSNKFNNPNVREAMKLICSIEMLNRTKELDHKKIIGILESAIIQIHGNSGTSPKFEWL